MKLNITFGIIIWAILLNGGPFTDGAYSASGLPFSNYILPVLTSLNASVFHTSQKHSDQLVGTLQYYSEPSPQSDSSTKQLAYGDRVKGILQPYTVDHYVFQANENDLVSIEIQSGFNFALELYDPDGNLLAVNDDGLFEDPDPVLALITLNTTGDYHIVVTRCYNLDKCKIITPPSYYITLKKVETISSSDFLARGNTYLVMGNYIEALADFTSAIESGSNSTNISDAYLMRGQTYSLVGDFETAIEDFNDAIELNGPTPDMYRYLGDAYFSLMDFTSAIENYDRAINATDSFDGGDHLYRALAHGYLGHYRATLADTNVTITNLASASDFDFVLPYLLQGIAYYGVMDYENSINSLNTAIEMARESEIYSPIGYLYRALALIGQEELQDAGLDLWQWISLSNNQIVVADIESIELTPVLPVQAETIYRILLQAEQDQRVVVQAASTDQIIMDPIIVLLDANGSPLATSRRIVEETNSDIHEYATLNFTFPESGSYSLLMTQGIFGIEGNLILSIALED